MWKSRRRNFTRIPPSWKASSAQRMATVDCISSDWYDGIIVSLQRNSDGSVYRFLTEVSIPISTTSLHFLRPRKNLRFQTSTSTSSAMAVTLLLVPPPSMLRNSSTSSRRRKSESSLPSSAGTMPWIVISGGRGSRSPPSV